MTSILATIMLVASSTTVDGNNYSIPYRVQLDSPTLTNLKEVCGKIARLPEPERNDEELLTASSLSDVVDRQDESATRRLLGPLVESCRELGDKERATLSIEAVTGLLRVGPDLSRITEILQAVTIGDNYVLKFNDVSESTVVQASPIGPVADIGLAGLQSRLLNGLADFVVDRAKAEAAFYIRNEIQEQLCKDDIEKLVPKTCATLAGLSSEVRLNAIGRSLVASVRSDIEELPKRLLELGVKQLGNKPGNNSAISAIVLARVALSVVDQAAGGRNVLATFAAIQDMASLSCETPSPKTSSCQEAMNRLRRASVIVDRINAQRNLENQLKKDTERKYALAALMIDIENALTQRKLGPLLGSDVKLAPQKYAAVLRVIFGAGRALGQLDKLSGKIKDKIEDEALPPSLLLEQQITLVVDAVGIFADLAAVVVGEEKYGPLVKSIMASTRRLVVSTIKKDYAALIVETPGLLALLPQVSDKVRIPEKLTKYVGLLAELASAESSDEVNKILSAAAEPVGSYRERYERFTLSFSSMLGAGIGREMLTGNGETATATGLLAPVGFHMSWPILWDYFHFGPFVSLIDVGALTSTRLSSELADDGESSVPTEPDVNFSQVLSPGLFGVLGIAKSPVSIGGGVSFVPAARDVTPIDTVTNAAGSPSLESAIRIQAFIALNIEIFTLAQGAAD